MNAHAKPVTQPMVILFGLSSIGKPRAGKFKGTEVAAARKAAAKLGLSLLEVADEAARAVAANVPAGRIAAPGDKLVPFVPKDLYAQIEAIGRLQINGQTGKQAANGKPGVANRRLPASWDDIKVGDCVLSQDSDPRDGWWQAIVVEKAGDLIKLRWPRSERGRPFQKHRLALGLICPGDDIKPAHPEPKKSATESTSPYPRSWAAIGLNQIVLAKEDGPCEQWWEAKTIMADKDVFTLQWRDCPDLPPIERPRSSLGLMNPAPKVR